MPPKSQTQQPRSTAKKAPAKKYFTKEGYDVKEEEMDYVHVVTSKFTLSGNYDKEVHKTAHILDPKMWDMCRKEWPKQGLKFEEMLHCPAGTPKGFVEAK